ncbi:MAG: LysR family transcriptional regulator [Pseudomonadota bacterium]
MFENLDWDKLKVFIVVAELGSMNAAASRLKETAPTVSRKIDDLERSLNARLLYRSPRGVTLTDAGKKTLRYAEIMSDAADGLRSDVLDHDSPAEGSVTLCTGDGLATHWLAPHLPDFHLQNPKIELRLETTDRPDADLINEKADVAIQFQEPTRPDIVSKRLGVLHYVFFASPDYIKNFGHPASVFDLYNHRCIIHSGYVNQMERWAPKAKEFRDLIDFALVTNSGAVMVEVCANGGGIALLPTYVHGLGKNIVPLNLPEVAPIRFWLTYTERVRRMARAQIVIDWLRGLFHQQKSPWFKPTFEHPMNYESGSVQGVGESLVVPESDAP